MSVKKLTIRTLNKGWHDRDEMLLHASFQILIDFVDKEHPGDIIDWSATRKHKKVWKEICRLYKWWKKDRPVRKSPLEDKKLKTPPVKFEKIPGSNCSRLLSFRKKKKYLRYYKAIDKAIQLEEKWAKEDQKNLHRLVKIRPFLWT